VRAARLMKSARGRMRNAWSSGVSVWLEPRVSGSAVRGATAISAGRSMLSNTGRLG
jgi:hypothetical protein